MVFESDETVRALPALYRMTAVEQRGSVLLEPCETHKGNVTQTFYPEARGETCSGPTTEARSLRYAELATPLAVRASRAALENAGTDSSAITHLIVITCTGFYAPGVDIELIEQLGLSTETQRVQVGFMGCHGAINGLRVAQGLLAAEPSAKVLMVSVELCSLHFQYGWDTDRVVSNAIFADGAAAIVLESTSLLFNGAREHPRLVATGSKLIPDSRDAMSWRIGDHGFQMTLSAEVPGIIEAKLRDYMEGWLCRSDLAVGDIRGWAVHPGGPKIVRATQDALGLSDDAVGVSREVLSQHGNMSSATMLFIIRRFIELSIPRPWVMVGFGPGLEIEVALLR